MITKVSPYLSVSREHRFYDFDGLERRYWDRKLDIWIETADVFDFFSDSNMAALELMVPRGDGYSRSAEQFWFPKHVAFIYAEVEP